MNILHFDYFSNFKSNLSFIMHIEILNKVIQANFCNFDFQEIQKKI